MKTLNSFEFAPAAAKAQHDWDAILDGKIHQMEPGTDYKCKAATFATLGRKAAQKRGMAVRVSKVEDGLGIQAVPGEANGGRRDAEDEVASPKMPKAKK